MKRIGLLSDTHAYWDERYLKIFMFMTFANGIQPVSSGFFTSIGMAKLGIVMSLTRQVIFSSAIDHYLSVVYGN